MCVLVGDGACNMTHIQALVSRAGGQRMEGDGGCGQSGEGHWVRQAGRASSRALHGRREKSLVDVMLGNLRPGHAEIITDA